MIFLTLRCTDLRERMSPENPAPASDGLASRAQEESRIAVSWLRRLESVLKDEDPALFIAALNAGGLSPSALSGNALVRLEQLDAAQLRAREGYPDITLRMYQAADLLDMGLIGYAMASSGTIRRAFEIAIRYHDVTSDRYQLELFKDGQEAVVRQVPFLEHIEEYQDMGEELAGVVKILQTLLGAQVDAAEILVDFAYPMPAHAATYGEVFPGPIRFQTEHSEVRFPAAWLDLAVTTANESTSEVCAAMCERVLGASNSETSARDVVRRLLVSRAGREIPSLEEAAETLRMSVSQLRKRLYREATSYKEIVLEVRMTLARHYLEATTLSVQEIAYLLDYSQAAPFSRAFKAYFGYPPQAARSV
jgi:AraC-like DNA-binding protein